MVGHEVDERATGAVDARGFEADAGTRGAGDGGVHGPGRRREHLGGEDLVDAGAVAHGEVLAWRVA